MAWHRQMDLSEYGISEELVDLGKLLGLPLFQPHDFFQTIPPPRAGEYSPLFRTDRPGDGYLGEYEEGWMGWTR
jgi:hypothetical protein